MSGASADGEKPKKKELKEPKAKDKESYDGATTDAAIVAAARLSHMFKGQLKADDILGYLYQIFLHYASMVFVSCFAFIWFLDLERKQDPWEQASVSFMSSVLAFAETNGVALSNITTAAQFVGNVTIPSNFSGENATAATYTLKYCNLILNDFHILHILFLTVFMGTILTRFFQLFHRVYVIAALPRDDFKKWEGYEAIGDAAACCEDKDDGFHYSMRNWNGKCNNIDHMAIPMKIVVLLFIIIPEVLFTLVAMYTGLKLFGVSVGSPVTLAKQALKASFLLKFAKLYFTNFTSHNMMIFLVGGEYWIPETEAEASDAKEEKDELEDADSSEKLSGWDMWNSWGSFFAKIILGFGLSILYLEIKEAPKKELKNACFAYQKTGAAMAYEALALVGWTPSEFPKTAYDTIHTDTIFQKIFYVPRA